MIRIVYTVDAPFLGGAEHYVARLATGLDPRAFRAAVVMRSNDADASLDLWADDLVSKGIPVVRVPMRLPFRPGDAVGIFRAIANFEPNVVHVNMPGPYTGQTGLLAPIARAAGARVVVTEHLPMVERLWKRAAVKRLAIRSVDLAVTMTNANANLLVARQGYRRERVRVVSNGVPFAYGTGPREAEVRSRLVLEADTVSILFVGNLIPHKGLQLAIEALSMSPSQPWRLLVVGSGPDEANAKLLAMRRGVADRVTFLGRRDAGEVERIVGACDVLVLPSSVEGLPYVILEAMACGKPVVSTRAYGIPEAVVDGETGLLVAPGDAGELGRALRAVIADRALRERMGRAGRARFEERFTLERQLAVMSSLYREVLAGVRVGGAA